MRQTFPRRVLLAGFLITATVALPAPARSQASEAPCTYEACALRLRPGGWFSGPKVVRGPAGVEVAGYGRRSTFEEMFASSDSAASHYAAFETHDRRADVLGAVAAALGLAATIVELRNDAHPSGWSVGLYAGGITTGLLARLPRRRAHAEFSDAMWWYNRELAEPDR